MRWLVVLLLLVACTPVQHEATARLLPTGEENVYGIVYFEEVPGGVRVRANLHGLSGVHGFHIHENGDCYDGGKKAGGHFNPYNVEHGSPESMEKHVGDLGNVDANGYDALDDVIQLVGPRSIIGKSVIIHKNSDDFGQPLGNAGARIACGIIV